jgi:hypothetical protein
MTFHDSAALPTSLQRAGGYLQSIHYDAMLDLVQRHGWSALQHSVTGLCSASTAAQKPRGDGRVEHAHHAGSDQRHVAAPARPQADRGPTEHAASGLRAATDGEAARLPQHAAAAQEGPGSSEADAPADGMGTVPGTAVRDVSQPITSDGGTSGQHGVHVLSVSQTSVRDSPDLWSTVFGPALRSPGAAAPPSSAGGRIAMDLTPLPEKLRHGHRHWHCSGDEGPVAEAEARERSSCSCESSASGPGPRRSAQHAKIVSSKVVKTQHGVASSNYASAQEHVRRGRDHDAIPIQASRQAQPAAEARTTNTAEHAASHISVRNGNGGAAMAAEQSPIALLQRALQAHAQGSTEFSPLQLARLQVQAQEYSAGLTVQPQPRHVHRLLTSQSTAESVDATQAHATPTDSWPASVPLQPSDCRLRTAHKHAPVSGMQSGQVQPVAQQLLSRSAVQQRVHKLWRRAAGRGDEHLRLADKLVALLLQDPTALRLPVHSLPVAVEGTVAQLQQDLWLALKAAHAMCPNVEGLCSAQHMLHSGAGPGSSSTALCPVWLDHVSEELIDESGASDCMAADEAVEPPAFWRSAGEACERLACLPLAQAAFQMAVRGPRLAASSCLALARIAAALGHVLETFEPLTDLLLRMDAENAKRSLDAVPRSHVAIISMLISRAGMRAVQQVLERTVGQVHESVDLVVELAFERGTDGCDA